MFNDWYAPRLHLRVRLSIPVITALILISVIGHALVFPDFVWQATAIFMPLGIVLPMLLTLKFLRGKPNLLQMRVALLFCCLGCLISLYGLHLYTFYEGFILPYEAFMLLILSMFVFSGLLTLDILLLGSLNFIAFLCMLYLEDTPLIEAAIKGFFMGCLSLVGGFAVLIIERSQRIELSNISKLEAQAEHDSLTGLMNRRGLHKGFEKLQHLAKREQRSLSIAIVDIDHFKTYNDSYGHQQGDVALQQVAAELSQQTRRPLDLCARLGGEEFILVWYDCPASDAPQLGENLCNSIKNLGIDHQHSSHDHRLTISVGLCTADSPASDFRTLYKEADEALYQAKTQGRNCAVSSSASPKVSAIEATIARKQS